MRTRKETRSGLRAIFLSRQTPATSFQPRVLAIPATRKGDECTRARARLDSTQRNPPRARQLSPEKPLSFCPEAPLGSFCNQTEGLPMALILAASAHRSLSHSESLGAESQLPRW